MIKHGFISGEVSIISRVLLGFKVNISRIIDRGHCEVACLQEAYAHYGDRFTRTDACLYFTQGALFETFRIVLREK
ncbi:hypothetical protein ABNP39_16435 [Pantoea dispersa]|uniref:hypothetical protein n=1 Tax=Pantoea dispersa TaxID=59814 RepID=UPI0032ED8EC2